MKNQILLFIAFLFILKGQAQLIVQLQLPQTGIFEKTQLWPMVLTNTTTSNQVFTVKLTFIDVATGQQVLSASTLPFSLKPGVKFMNAQQFGPVQYNVLSSSYMIDPSPYGLLPVGNFQACFSFYMQGFESGEKVLEECSDLVIEPLSPPQLIYPFNEAVLAETTPMFSWLPPAPITIFTKVSYDIKVVEVLPNQTAVEAIIQNVPLLGLQNLSTTAIPYPLSMPALQIDKVYAWKIIAKSLQAPVGESETWQFTLKQPQANTSITNVGLPYVKLKKELESGYAIFAGALKIDYLNETEDSTWNIKLYDLTDPNRREVPIDFGAIPLSAGQNLVDYPIEENLDLKDKNHYLLEVTNSKNEVWRVRFQYRKSIPE